jgi:hypothetical protein
LPNIHQLNRRKTVSYNLERRPDIRHTEQNPITAPFKAWLYSNLAYWRGCVSGNQPASRRCNIGATRNNNEYQSLVRSAGLEVTVGRRSAAVPPVSFEGRMPEVCRFLPFKITISADIGRVFFRAAFTSMLSAVRCGNAE